MVKAKRVALILQILLITSANMSLMASTIPLRAINACPVELFSQTYKKIVNDSASLVLLREKLRILKKIVAEAKAKGIETKYEEITIKTAELFLDTYIPWDIIHKTDLFNAYSRTKKEDLKGIPDAEAERTPVWELQQTSEILDGALAKLKTVIKRPSIRRHVPPINIDHLVIKDGFLNSDGQTTFSGGFIWGKPDMDSVWLGRIGVDVGPSEFINFSSLQSDGTLSKSTISDILRKLDNLKAKGLKGSISIGQSIPSWAISQWPDIDDYKGHFFSYDIDHPKVRELWGKFMASLIPAVRNHPATFDYQLCIEPMWPSIGTWMIKNASPYAFQKYQTWLRNLYTDIAGLNKSWGTAYNDFSEITSRPPDNSNPSMWYDWIRFNQWRVTDIFKFMQDEIHKYDPNGLCHIRISVGGINAGGSGTNAYTDLHFGIDREALVRMLGINGLDNSIHDNGMLASSGRIYKPHKLYNQDAYSLRWLGAIIVLDFIRSIQPDKLIYDSEWHSASSMNYLNPEPPAGYMHTALWLSTLHGMGASKIWYWSRNIDGSIVRNSSEEFYGSILVQPRLLNEYGTGLAELNAFATEVSALERESKQIYLLYSDPSAIQSADYLNDQMNTYEALHFTGLPIGFVTENELKTTGLPPSCKLLVIANDNHVSPATLDWLRNYMHKGGRPLIIGNNTLKFNEYGKPYSSAKLEFLTAGQRFETASTPELFNKIDAFLTKTDIKREVRCIENSNKQTVFGVLCRSTDFKGGKLICLINLSAVTKEASLELNGKSIKNAVNLFDNKTENVREISMEPLTVRLFLVSK